MSRKTREELEFELGQAVRTTQAAVDSVDAAVAVHLGVNRTDLRCLEILTQDTESATPGELAGRLSLTTGSVTAMIDRLERLGYLRRAPDPSDRRKVAVFATPEVTTALYDLMRPMMELGTQMVARYTDEEIELVTDFHRRDRELQESQAARVRALPPRARVDRG